MKIEILCTGEEILSGKTVNTNYSHIARVLVEHGFIVAHGATVGDDLDALLAAFQQAALRADAVIVNGGLGPTLDDLSQEAAAAAVGEKLVLREDWLRRMEEAYRKWNREMPKNNRKQAMLPGGAELIDNPIGTACGFALDIDGVRFFFTPGVPRELFRMLDEQVLPRLQKMRGRDIHTRIKRFHTFGIGESRADGLLAEVEALDPDGLVRLGFQSHYPQLETKLTLTGEDPGELDRRLEPAQALVREKLGDYLLCEDAETLEGVIAERLATLGGSLFIAECGTGGQVCARLLADDVRGQGIVTVGTDQLASALGIKAAGDQEDLAGFARNAAAQVAQKQDASHGLCVLVAGWGSTATGNDGVVVNIAITDGSSAESRSARLPGKRGWVRKGATEMTLDCLRRYLFRLPVYQKVDFELQ